MKRSKGVDNPAPKHVRRLQYGVRDDATWGAKWVDEIEVEDTSPESIANSKHRRYLGDEYGDLVVAWFNEMASTRRNRIAYQRVCRLFRALLKVPDILGDQEVLQKIATSRPGKIKQEIKGKLNQLKDIGKQLQHYSQHPQYFVMKTHDVGFHAEASTHVQPVFNLVPSEGRNFREQSTVSAILELAQMGLLHKVRRCDWVICRRWFYARFPHQRFCKEQCKNAYCNSKGFKAEHAAKQREIDELHRSGKVKTKSR
jgi:hypothetical protein